MKKSLIWFLVTIAFFGFMLVTCIEAVKASELQIPLSGEHPAFISDDCFFFKYPVCTWGLVEMQASYIDSSCWAVGAVFVISF